MIPVLCRYILTASLRDKFVLGFFVFLAVAISLSLFLGSSAVNEPDQFSLVFAATGLRIGGALMLLLFVVSYLRRTHESRDVEYLLSRPVTRLQFLLAHFISFSVMATVLAIMITLAISFMPMVKNMQADFLLWGVSLWAEFIILSVTAMFFGMVLSSSILASLAGIGFYVLCRLIGEILGIINAGLIDSKTIILQKIMTGISLFIPRLDLMGQSAWLLYGGQGSIGYGFIAIQTVIFSTLIFSAAYLDLRRKQF